MDANGKTLTLAVLKFEKYQPASQADHLKDFSPEDLQPIRSRLASGWKSRVTRDQERAINDYVTEPAINAKLRTKPDLSSLSLEELEQFESVEQSIALAGKRSEVTVMWRGVHPNFYQSTLRALAKSLDEDRPFREHGIQSYSIQPSVAGFIAGEKGLVLELRSRSGIYVSDLANGNEEEVLMSHFARYKVVEFIRSVIIANEYGEKVSVTLARLKE